MGLINKRNCSTPKIQYNNSYLTKQKEEDWTGGQMDYSYSIWTYKYKI